MPTVTAHLDPILHARLKARARQRFGQDDAALSRIVEAALERYLETSGEPASNASLTNNPAQARPFSFQDYDRWADAQPHVSSESVEQQLANIKAAPIIERAPYVRADGRMKRIPFQLPDVLDQSISTLVAHNVESPWLRDQYGVIDASTIIRDQLARHLLAGRPLDLEPALGGRIFGLCVNAKLLALLEQRLDDLKATGNVRKNAGLATVVKRTLTAALSDQTLI